MVESAKDYNYFPLDEAEAKEAEQIIAHYKSQGYNFVQWRRGQLIFLPALGRLHADIIPIDRAARDIIAAKVRNGQKFEFK